jgi:hypothetical protein
MPGRCRAFRLVRPAGRTHLEVRVLYTPGKGKCQLNGNGVHREVESGGSRRQSAGLTNRKRIEAAQWGEQANLCEARFLHGTLRRRSDRQKREGECVIPGEI